MHVITMRIEQAIADIFPGTLGPCPRAEELDRVAGRLRPSPIHLQGFVEPPPQVLLAFSPRDGAACLGEGGPSGPLERSIPPLLPTIKPNAIDCIDVGC